MPKALVAIPGNRAARRRNIAVRIPGLLALVLLAACEHEPVVSDEMMRFEGAMPADFSGSWERDYTRGDDAYAVLRKVFWELNRRAPGVSPQPGMSVLPHHKQAAVYALAQLADEITRPQVLTISQSEYEISVARKDDYSIFCAFYDGRAKSMGSDFGTEVCGWDGDHLVSHVALPGGLRITHTFTVSQDREQLRVITTVESSAVSVPFTLSRFYRRFEAPKSDFNCVETLSMKRVCSTGDLDL